MADPLPAAASDAPDEARVRALLAQVMDPEAGVSVIDMGLVYRIQAGADEVRVDMTMTSPACPMGEMILDDARAALEAGLPPRCRVDVRLVWEPPWTPALMSAAARRHLGWDAEP